MWQFSTGLRGDALLNDINSTSSFYIPPQEAHHRDHSHRGGENRVSPRRQAKLLKPGTCVRRVHKSWLALDGLCRGEMLWSTGDVEDCGYMKCKYLCSLSFLGCASEQLVCRAYGSTSEGGTIKMSTVHVVHRAYAWFFNSMYELILQYCVANTFLAASVFGYW